MKTFNMTEFLHKKMSVWHYMDELFFEDEDFFNKEVLAFIEQYGYWVEMKPDQFGEMQIRLVR